MLAGSIANDKLVNSAITINGTSTSLGGSIAVGTVTSVGGAGTVNGLTLTGTVTTTGNLTLGGTLTGVDLTTQVTGTLPIANGGTNATTASGARTSLGLGTSAVLDAAVALGTATLDAGGTVPLSQIPASIQGGLNYQGTWDASTNTPTLVSSVGSKGYYYAVSVAGSTNLNGITDWNIGDLAVYDGTAWQKIDNTDAVTSVNGFTGSVVLTTTNVAEGTNEYFTTARARSSVSAGTGITYNSTTGVITNALPSLGGDVVGAASSTDNAVTRFDGTTGKLIQNSAVIIDDTNSVTGVNSLTATTLVINDNTTLGSSNTDSLAVNARITTDLEPNANNAKDIGTSGRNWRDGFFGRNLSTVNLAVTGTTSYDGAQGTSGQVLTSAGTGNTPTWTTPTTGTVTSVGGTGTVNGITLTGTVTTSGNLTLGGTLSGVNLTTQVTGTLPPANGGTGITSLGAGVATFLGTPTSANLAAAVTNETGTGALVFGTSPTLTTPTITGGTVNPTTLQENGISAVVQTDIGTAPNEIPLNQYLGNLAYQDAANIAGNVGVGGALTVTGTSTVQAGTAALPSITPTGDTNTGLFFPAADTIAFSEGGVEAMRINSSGNVGIGTATPTVRFTVGAYVNAGINGTAGIYGSNLVAANTAGILTIGATDALAADIGGSIGFTANAGAISGYPTGSIAGRRENATSGNYASYMQFTTASSAGGVAERMRLDSAGNLGLGVTPRAWAGSFNTMQLGIGGSIYGRTVTPTQITVGANAFFDSNFKYVGTGQATLYGQSDGAHSWSTAPSGTAGNAITFTQAMTLTAAGNLGIGTTTPNASALLDVQSTTKGVRMPNMTTTQKNAIASPAAGLMVFDTTLSKLCVYTTAWETITSV
jgi:hypothetical protein